MYESSFELTYEDAKNKIFDMLDFMDEKGLTEDADNILLSYVDKPEDIQSLNKRQMQTIQAIHDELENYLKANGLSLEE